jgi:hypothetical protein
MHLVALLLLLAQDGNEGRTLSAEFTSLEGRTLVVSQKKDNGLVIKVTLSVAEDVSVVIDGVKAKLSDLKPGRAVEVQIRDGAVRRIEAAAPPREGGDREGSGVNGEVTRIADGALVLGLKREGQKPAELTLKIDKEAVILVDGEKAKLEDLKPGTTVRVLVRREVAVRIEATRKRDEAKPAEKPKAPEAKAPEKPAEKPKAPEAKAPEKPAEKPKAPEAKAPEKPAEKPKAPEAKAPEKPAEKPKAPEAKASEKPAEKPKPPEVKPPEPPAEPPKPFPVDESIVPKGEKYPDLGGRVLSVFVDGPTILVTIRQNNEELPFYIPKDAIVTYIGLEKPDQKPRVGYLAYAWLRPGSKDTASSVRFGRSK